MSHVYYLPSTVGNLKFGIFLFIFVANGGSFLNVLACRIPVSKSIVFGSYHCNQTIRCRDNDPVLGWLWLHGRCRD
jgi:leader peptidase (prepilin peptidase) / N-methyltransferase